MTTDNSSSTARTTDTENSAIKGVGSINRHTQEIMHH